MLLLPLGGFTTANPIHYSSPEVTIVSPITNRIYDSNNVSITVKVEMTNWDFFKDNEELKSLNYSLDVQPEASALVTNEKKPNYHIEGLAKATLSGLPDGAHSLHIHGQTHFSQSNTTLNNFEDTIFFIVKNAEQIQLVSPQSTTYKSTSILLDYRSIKAIAWVGYCLDQKTVVSCPSDNTLRNLFNGVHTLRLYGKDSQGNVFSSKEVSFTIDGKAPPVITMNDQAIKDARKTLPPDYKNKTWLLLKFYVNVPTTWLGYSLDGKAIETIEGNTTIGPLVYGRYTVIVYAKDDCGNMGQSQPYNVVLSSGEIISDYKAPASEQAILIFDSNVITIIAAAVLTVLIISFSLVHLILKRTKK
jgi:hypothetical protein